MSTIPTCSRRLGRGTCHHEATAMVNGEPRCFDHTPKASDRYDVMPLHTPEPLPLCGCGCGNSVLRKSRTYLQGHDQRHRGQLLRAFDKGDAGAGDELVKRGWKSDAELADRKLVAEEKAARKAAMTEAEPEAEPATTPRVSRGRTHRSDRAPMAHIGNAAS